MRSFMIAPLTEHTGAEVTGLDFRRPIDAEIRAALNRAFIDRHVLVMRDQQFGPDEFKSAVQLFGELQPHDRRDGGQRLPDQRGAEPGECARELHDYL